MKRSMFGVLFIAALVGCSSTPDSVTKTYLLPQAETRDTSEFKEQPILLVQPVKVAGYLAGEGIAYQTSETEVVIAQSNLWGENLSQQVAERLVTQLRRGKTRYWAMFPNSSLNGLKMPRLQVNISRFEGDYRGAATVAGEWVLVDGNGDVIGSNTFYAQESLEKEGYQALVLALSIALDTAIDDMTLDLNRVGVAR
ncbi:PqiC family protein [Grimontia marina]|uniref:ABC-type transport auxiliary lipoprotein component domain-containing protein n=1 Tax=Grimontia marina TaxID=646534 RepID=A0A128F7B2_9GAMM|nr:ABC-type transport auxiliary lipoprotein family protein [Grimontia marina]CZF82683.1 hypothetical protein GMA8713_02321 [Grimontia marina]